MKLSVLITFSLFLFTGNVSSQESPDILWGKKIKKAKNISHFIENEEHLVAYNSQVKAIQIYSSSSLELEWSVDLKDLYGKLRSEEILISKHYIELCEYDNTIGMLVKYSKEHESKTYYGIFPLDDNLKDISTIADVLYETENKKFTNSELIAAEENLLTIVNYNTTGERNAEIVAVIGDREGLAYPIPSIDDITIRVMNSDDIVMISKKNYTKIELEIYDAASGSLLTEFVLKEELGKSGRVLNLNKLKSGNSLITGIYGDFSGRKNQMEGIFRIELDEKGQVMSNKTKLYSASDLEITQEETSVNQVQTTDNGDIYMLFNSTVSSGLSQLTDAQSMIIAIVNDEIWSKSVPFRQGNGTTYYPEHLGMHLLISKSGELVILYNDQMENHKRFDYNDFTYSKQDKPDRYICSVPGVCTILQFDKKGDLKPYAIDLEDEFLNLKTAQILEDGTIFISANSATIAGGGRPKFAKITLN